MIYSWFFLPVSYKRGQDLKILIKLYICRNKIICLSSNFFCTKQVDERQFVSHRTFFAKKLIVDCCFWIRLRNKDITLLFSSFLLKFLLIFLTYWPPNKYRTYLLYSITRWRSTFRSTSVRIINRTVIKKL